MVANIIIALLVAIVVLLGLIVVKAQYALRNLSAKRLDVYTELLGATHELFSCVKKGKGVDEWDHSLLEKFALIASIPTNEISTETIDAIFKFHQKKWVKRHLVKCLPQKN